MHHMSNKEYMDMWCIAINIGHSKMTEVTHRLVFVIPVIVEYLYFLFFYCVLLPFYYKSDDALCVS